MGSAKAWSRCTGTVRGFALCDLLGASSQFHRLGQPRPASITGLGLSWAWIRSCSRPGGHTTPCPSKSGWFAASQPTCRPIRYQATRVVPLGCDDTRPSQSGDFPRAPPPRTTLRHHCSVSGCSKGCMRRQAGIHRCVGVTGTEVGTYLPYIASHSVMFLIRHVPRLQSRPATLL